MSEGDIATESHLMIRTAARVLAELLGGGRPDEHCGNARKFAKNPLGWSCRLHSPLSRRLECEATQSVHITPGSTKRNASGNPLVGERRFGRVGRDVRKGGRWQAWQEPLDASLQKISDVYVSQYDDQHQHNDRMPQLRSALRTDRPLSNAISPAISHFRNGCPPAHGTEVTYVAPATATQSPPRA